MSNILDPNKQESISKFEILEEKNGVLKIQIVANSALQREIYEQLYKKLSKTVEVEGFRKGHAPRELVEPKIYAQLADELVNQVAYLMVMELPNKLDEKYLLIGSPVIEKVDFKVVESPVVVTLKAFVITGKKIPDLATFKVEFDAEQVKVEQAEIETAINQVFSEWKKQKKDESLEKPDDKWAKELKVPGVDTLEDLKKHIEDSIRKEKIVREKIKLFEETFAKIIEATKIDIPTELVDKQMEAALEQKKQEVERFGITLEKYLEYYKKDINSFKEELRKQVEKELKQETLKQLYVKQFNIKLEKTDHGYLELAMAQLRVPPEALQDFQVLQLVAQLGLTFKVFDDIAEKIGLGKIYASMIHHHHHHESGTNSAETQSKDEDNKPASSKKEGGKASKILIAEE